MNLQHSHRECCSGSDEAIEYIVAVEIKVKEELEDMFLYGTTVADEEPVSKLELGKEAGESADMVEVEDDAVSELTEPGIPARRLAYVVST